MIKIAFYGIGNNARQLIRKVINIGYAELICCYETKKTANSFSHKKVYDYSQIDWTQFDYLVVTPSENSEIYELLKKNDGYAEEKVITPSHLLRILMNNLVESIDYDDWYNFSVSSVDRNYSNITSVCVNNNLRFIGSADDRVVMDSMKRSGCTFSEFEILAFFELTSKYYDVNWQKNGGYFIDIGANIGTTSIFVKRVINSYLNVVAIEPEKNNIKMLKLNSILNDTDFTIVELGLSDSVSNSYVRYNVDNPADCRIVEKIEGNTDTCSLTTLDCLLKEYDIDAKNVDYIWLDVQGYEMKALFGADELLRKRRVPIFMEFNPTCYSDEDIKKWIKLMSINYSYFIVVDFNLDLQNPIIHEFDDIYDVAIETKKQDRPLPSCDIFLF